MNDDWDKPTILRKSRPTSKDLKSSAAVNQALAKGNVEISLKEGASKNKRDKDAVNFSKIESSEELKGKSYMYFKSRRLAAKYQRQFRQHVKDLVSVKRI